MWSNGKIGHGFVNPMEARDQRNLPWMVRSNNSVHGWRGCCPHQVDRGFRRSPIICGATTGWTGIHRKRSADWKHRRRGNPLGDWRHLESNHDFEEETLYPLREHWLDLEGECWAIKIIYWEQQNKQNKLQCGANGISWIDSNASHNHPHACHRDHPPGLW